jgi:phospholipase/carboxylesterase
MSTPAILDAVEVETGKQILGSVIWMHGLGADAHDFEPIVPELDALVGLPLRFVFPNAPVRPITVNAGHAMRAWFDIVSFGGPPDETATRASAASIRALMRRENERGVASDRIVLAGFSQGGAMAVFTGVRHPERIAGIMALSCFDPLPGTLAAERNAANQHTPIFMAHGTQDPMVPLARARMLESELTALGHAVEWHDYPMPHSVSMEEVRDIGAWLQRVFAPAR